MLTTASLIVSKSTRHPTPMVTPSIRSSTLIAIERPMLISRLNLKLVQISRKASSHLVTRFQGCSGDINFSRHISCTSDHVSLLLFLNYFCSDKSAFCGATGALCFRLRLTLPLGFKVSMSLARNQSSNSDQAGA